MKSKKKQPICPVCNTPTHRTEMTTAVSIMEKIEKAEFKHYKELKINSYETFIDSNFDWACDLCLSKKKAIPAIPSIQSSSSYPNLAYFDSEINCRSCNKVFIFSKEEKKHWYEKLKFHHEAVPVNCVDCRKEVRHLKNQNNLLTEILRKEEKEISSDELDHVITIYEEWEKEDKVKYYKALLRKK